MQASSIIRYEHSVKDRYYQMVLSRDLFGDWMITKTWGTMKRAAGRIAYSAHTNQQEALLIIAKLAKMREKTGYIRRDPKLFI